MSAYPNTGVFIGHSSRLGYDTDYFNDRVSESVGPLAYRLSTNQINNCNGCLSVFGPRTTTGSAHSQGVSSVASHNDADALKLVSLESILSNRNVIQSKSKRGNTNPVNPLNFSLNHARVCNDFLDPVSTHLTNPPINYRGVNINRFYNLDRNPQLNIFYDFSTNTKLEAKDNYKEKIPRMIVDKSLPNFRPADRKSLIGC
jgi:hypothetical protein